ncbi:MULTISPECIES: hypothetical protein [Streptomyces]|uniref:hypothetical protein n=1 Tax=Streptomyces TaxID=1883 RepID=UPI001FAD3E6A|nr:MULTISPECIES: hypothetical protein [unclassified Streptomyces]MDX2918216.1 hypothetical protein [Streptomyces sp. NE06-03C]MDX3606366.1 hypothetical protein [Streptomyces sp. FL06-04B]MDX3734146.1 hypothetical protein [Streptomyces sp. ID01-15D]
MMWRHRGRGGASREGDVKVVGIPENSSIRAAGSSREACGEVCNRRPFSGTW